MMKKKATEEYFNVNWDAIRAAMEEKGMTGTQISLLLKKQKSYISGMSSQNARLSRETIDFLKILLGLSAEDMLLPEPVDSKEISEPQNEKTNAQTVEIDLSGIEQYLKWIHELLMDQHNKQANFYDEVIENFGEAISSLVLEVTSLREAVEEIATCPEETVKKIEEPKEVTFSGFRTGEKETMTRDEEEVEMAKKVLKTKFRNQNSIPQEEFLTECIELGIKRKNSTKAYKEYGCRVEGTGSSGKRTYVLIRPQK